MAAPETFAEEFRAFASRATPYPADRFAGRGIVICAGGTRYFTNAWVLIWVLRRVLGCELPIQVWHLGRAEMSDGMRHLLLEQEVEVVDASRAIACNPARVAAGWPLKPYAIAQCRFQEVIHLDADTVPFVDPATIFDWPEYAEAGSLFWPDLIDIRAENPIWQALGLDPEDCMSFETSVLAIDKSRTWQALQLTIWLNEHWDWLYDILYGDKDTFLIAWRYLDLPHGLISHRPIESSGVLLQRDSEGEVILEHRTAAKFALRGDNFPVSRARFETACQEALKALKREWHGDIFHAPERSEQAHAMERQLSEIGTFDYRNSERSRRIELCRGNRIRDGRSAMKQHWAVVDQDAGLALEFFSDAMATVRLSRDEDGVWRGRSLVGPPFDATLAASNLSSQPEGDAETEPRREAAILVDQILDMSIIGCGFDAALADELCTALGWIARTNSHTLDALRAALARSDRPIPDSWRARLEEAAERISVAETERRANAKQETIPMPKIDPSHYERQL